MEPTRLATLAERILIELMSQKSQFKDELEFEEMIVNTLMSFSSELDIDGNEFMELVGKNNAELEKQVVKVIDSAFGLDEVAQ